MRRTLFPFFVAISTIAFVLNAPPIVHDTPDFAQKTDSTFATDTDRKIETFSFVPVPTEPKSTTEEQVVLPVAEEHTPASSDAATTVTTSDTEIRRPPALYSFPPVSFDEINVLARGSLVNILCSAGTTSVSPISASGVLVHHSGVILTNAHVGQYLLLEQDPRIPISCEVRTGSPARSIYEAELVYLPPLWVSEHAHQISEFRPLGTGEHDWAVLRITESLDGSPLPVAFPFLSPEIREAAGFTEDQVLLASYPAGFIDGNTVQNHLYAASTVTTIKKLYTFLDGSVDLLSLGGVIVAQGGSSGGAVMNAWNHLIGVIVTSSEAETTSERDLRAITLAHIDRSMRNQLGVGLNEFLASDIPSRARDFRENIAPNLIEQFVPFLQEE